MSEILLLRGKLQQLKKEKNEIELQAQGLIFLIRQRLNPYIVTFENMEIEEAQVNINKLHELQEKLKALNKEIEKIEAEING